jgi:hypothetical protein
MTPRDGHGHGHAERWYDSDAGPVVRPYALTKGRTQASGTFGLIDVVAATGERPSPQFRPGPEHRLILAVCRRPVPVVDLTSEINLPLGVVRVLLSDLAAEGMLRIVSAQRQPVPDHRLLRMVLDGLESLLRPGGCGGRAADRQDPDRRRLRRRQDHAGGDDQRDPAAAH